MQSLTRTVLYGVGIWVIWVSLVVVAFKLLPSELDRSAVFASMRLIALVLCILSFTILYLRRVKQSSAGEGLLVGLSWTAIMVALDLAHYLMEPFNIAAYFGTTAPVYVVIPMTTTLIMGTLKQKA